MRMMIKAGASPLPEVRSLPTFPVSSPLAHQFYGSFTSSSENRALSLSPIWRAILIIGNTVARTFKHVEYRAAGTAFFEMVPDHPIERLLNKPSRFYNAFTFYTTMSGFSVLYGNAYAYIRRGPDQKPIEMIVIHPQDVSIRFNYKTGDYYYEVTLPTKVVAIVDPMDMLHLSGLNMDSPHLVGKNPLFIHKDTIETADAIQNYQHDFFVSGGQLGGYLYTPEHLSTREVEEIQQEFDTAVMPNGPIKRTPVLHSGLEYKVVKLTPKDSMVVELSSLSVEDASRITGVPLHMLSHLERSTFTNIEQQNAEFLDFTLEPHASNWEDETRKKLFFESKQNTTRTRFSTWPIRGADSDNRGQLYTRLMSIGALSPNTIIQLESHFVPGLKLRKDEEGDKYFTLVNVMTEEERAARLEQQKAAAIGSGANPGNDGLGGSQDIQQ